MRGDEHSSECGPCMMGHARMVAPRIAHHVARDSLTLSYVNGSNLYHLLVTCILVRCFQGPLQQ